MRTGSSTAAGPSPKSTRAGTDTIANGINDAGQIVGYFYNGTGEHGFLDSGGTFTQIDAPGATDTGASGINDAGQIVGNFFNSTGEHGFLDSGGTFTQIGVPGATVTDVAGINDAGQIVGSFSNGTVMPYHGFLDSGGTFTQIDAPGADFTQADGINDAGQIVGYATVAGGIGDPHFTTYNGQYYNFQGIGDFLLARSTVGGDRFDVRFARRPGKTAPA